IFAMRFHPPFGSLRKIAQRFGAAVEAFLGAHLRAQGGIDRIPDSRGGTAVRVDWRIQQSCPGTLDLRRAAVRPSEIVAPNVQAPRTESARRGSHPAESIADRGCLSGRCE